MPKLVFDEWYGWLTYAQRAAYRKYNVPPAMHRDLERRFGGNATMIVNFIKATVTRKDRIDYGDI